MKELFLQHGFQDHQVKIINLFVDVPNSQDEPNLSRDPNVVFVGRIDRYKGVDFLLKSLSKIKASFKCNVVGEGPLLAHCKRLSRRLGLEKSVTFLGWLPREEAEVYLGDANIVVVPSVMPEAFGMVGLEAMAREKPVVAFDNGGISDWLEDGRTGYLVPSKDTAAMADRIDFLLGNPEHAQQLGNAGRQSVERNFNKRKHFDRLIGVFEDACRA